MSSLDLVYSGFLVGCPHMREVNFDPCTAEAPDQAVFKLYTLSGKPEGELTP